MESNSSVNKIKEQILTRGQSLKQIEVRLDLLYARISSDTRVNETEVQSLENMYIDYLDMVSEALQCLIRVMEEFGFPTSSMVGYESANEALLLFYRGEAEHTPLMLKIVTNIDEVSEKAGVPTPRQRIEMKDHYYLVSSGEQQFGTSWHPFDYNNELIGIWPPAISDVENLDTRRESLGIETLLEEAESRSEKGALAVYLPYGYVCALFDLGSLKNTTVRFDESAPDVGIPFNVDLPEVWKDVPMELIRRRGVEIELDNEINTLSEAIMNGLGDAKRVAEAERELVFLREENYEYIVNLCRKKGYPTRRAVGTNAAQAALFMLLGFLLATPSEELDSQALSDVITAMQKVATSRESRGIFSRGTGKNTDVCLAKYCSRNSSNR